ncbi:hypothetical protein GME_14940 [Halomonas sp. TD01]|nr:hypothetical protein GME_14940 [Halomonas sp. TD01]
MQEILVDRYQFVTEGDIEMLNDLGITFHDVTFLSVQLLR